jgi:hypothetical protein
MASFRAGVSRAACVPTVATLSTEIVKERGTGAAKNARN